MYTEERAPGKGGMLERMGLFGGTDPKLQYQLARIEKKLDLIMESLGLSVPEDGMDDVRAMAAKGEKIEAIKLYRDRTGAGLYEAKQFVDGL